MKISLLCAASILSIVLATNARSQDPLPLDLKDRVDEVARVSAVVTSTLVLDPQRKIIVEGDLIWSSMITGAREIVFKPGSRLVLNKEAPHAAGEFFVVADKIVIEDPNNPGQIVWSSLVPNPPADRGEAPGGSAGGGHGAGGAAGGEGGPGFDAPHLTLMVKTIVNGGLVIDMSGGKGGPGSIGQKGGRGGVGAQGHPARQARKKELGVTIWLPWCDNGPGWGGAGGNGGLGGQGGKGGSGGAGGNITLVSQPDSLETLFQIIRIKNGGGDGGAPGAGGGGGDPGQGGPEGQLANFCNSAGRTGPAGQPGSSGPTGEKGGTGRSGQPFVARMTGEEFTKLFNF